MLAARLSGRTRTTLLSQQKGVRIFSVDVRMTLKQIKFQSCYLL